ncbi:hypothetical protein CDL15_Pgr015322 [Punica granatum]|uniref:Uncharacterized protein n=1 Tax=Punica granatum TaxID=22663 RepID=A0A218VZ72_PUNGR|nr:hypothetical protein CDL15_Pgr015322 [Punica granatum]
MTSDAFLWLVGDLAEERGLPWVAIRTGGCRSALAFAETDLILSTFGTGTDCEDKVFDFIPGLSNSKCRDLHNVNTVWEP